MYLAMFTGDILENSPIMSMGYLENSLILSKILSGNPFCPGISIAEIFENFSEFSEKYPFLVTFLATEYGL